MNRKIRNSKFEVQIRQQWKTDSRETFKHLKKQRDGQLKKTTDNGQFHTRITRSIPNITLKNNPDVQPQTMCRDQVTSDQSTNDTEYDVNEPC